MSAEERPAEVELCGCGIPKADARCWHRTTECDCMHHRPDKCITHQTIAQLEQMLKESAAALDDGE